MGIGLSSFANLAWLATNHPSPNGEALMLGRQKFRLVKSGAAKSSIETDKKSGFDKVLRQARITGSASDFIQPDGYSETMFEKLGFGRVETLDYSPFESAQWIWDLNKPVPKDWHGRFAFIFDGGTLEHVFDVRQSFENMYDMLAEGGIFASSTTLNNWPDHGFYQFTPEFAYTYWTRARGCEMLRCVSCTPEIPEVQHFPDPLATGARLKVIQPRAALGGMGKPKRLYMWYALRKPTGATVRGEALQSDYTMRWTGDADARSETVEEIS